MCVFVYVSVRLCFVFPFNTFRVGKNQNLCRKYLHEEIIRLQNFFSSILLPNITSFPGSKYFLSAGYFTHIVFLAQMTSLQSTLILTCLCVCQGSDRLSYLPSLPTSDTARIWSLFSQIQKHVLTCKIFSFPYPLSSSHSWPQIDFPT